MADTKVQREFREQVLTGIAELKLGHDNIVARLDKLNGSVAKHEADLNIMKLSDARQEGIGKTAAVIAKAAWGIVGGAVLIVVQHFVGK